MFTLRTLLDAEQLRARLSPGVRLVIVGAGFLGLEIAATARWLGANFWSRTGGPLMWRNYDPAVIDTELAVLERHGLSRA